MKKCIWIYGLALLLIAAAFSTAAGQARLPGERPYEPVVLKGGVLGAFYADSTNRAPVNDLFLYAYDSATWSWRMMPFQIDERILAPDPNNAEIKRHSYFIPDDGLIDLDDELVFMVRDMGDQAPEKGWIPNPESKDFNRLELHVYDPDDPSLDAYAYLFRSPTITDAVPAPYEFIYHEAQDSVESKYYAVGLGPKTGLVEDIVIKPPFGSGVDIFDRQKIRATAVLGAGVLDFHFPKVTESLIKLVPGYREVTKKPVVRLVREVQQTFNLGIADLEEGMTFYVTTRFYPFNGRVAGGSALDDASLREAMPKWDDPFILFEVLRQSWDLNANAVGMRFFSKHNSGILVDGKPDVVNKAIEKPVRDWTLITGEQGALFSLTSLPDTVASSISLYYYDNSTGGTGDPNNLGYYDTPETPGAEGFGSYGDFGFSMFNAKSLELSFEMYFLPNTVNTVEQAEKLAHVVEKPVLVRYSVATGVAGRPDGAAPGAFTLAQNHPNPFNQETAFSFSLPKTERIVLDIFDARGCLVRRLAQGVVSAGEHQMRWDGRGSNGITLASGIYFYQLSGENQTARNKLLLLR